MSSATVPPPSAAGAASRPNRIRSAFRAMSSARRCASVLVVASVARFRQQPAESFNRAYQVFPRLNTVAMTYSL
ncbi:MAG TPA: hypothetical protein VIG99_27850, partial [Myxococcaceae bacterium]